MSNECWDALEKMKWDFVNGKKIPHWAAINPMESFARRALQWHCYANGVLRCYSIRSCSRTFNGERK